MTTTFEPVQPVHAPVGLPEPPPSTHPGRSAPARRDTLMIVAVMVSCMALIAGVFGVGLGWRAVDEARSTGGAGADAGARTASVHLGEFSITPASVTVASGGTLDVHNDGAVPHNVAIEGSDIISPMLNAGETAHLRLAGLAPGTYTLVCQVVGHADAGMRSTLVVTGDGAAQADAHTAAAPAGGGHTMSNAEMDAAMEKSIKAFPAKTEGLGAQDRAPKVLADGTKQFELTASVVKWEVEPGRTVDAWTYNGTVPGPTLRADHGDKVQVVLRNNLPESTAIHFHGLTTPNAADGVTYITQPPIKPGETFTYSFTAQATPAVGMYHSHHNAVTQVPNGLAGTFLVGKLPVPAGVTVASEQIMMVNDAGAIGFSLNGKSLRTGSPWPSPTGRTRSWSGRVSGSPSWSMPPRSARGRGTATSSATPSATTAACSAW